MRIVTKIRRAGLGAALVSLAALAACSFEVTNPGPVQGKYMSDPAAAPALVNGAGRDLSDALNWIAYTGGAATREIFPAGSTGSFGVTVKEQIGILSSEADEGNAFWNRGQRARWEAEHADSTLKANLDAAAYAKSGNIAQVKVWAGYANRLLGENFCDAVIDGGAKQPYTVFLQRAEQNFTDAITVATAANNPTLANAAKAGRAAVRADLGNWSGAASDAAGIADAFVYVMPYFTTDADQYNRIYWATANSPYRAHTVWNTYYQQYYTDSKDPRVAWKADPKYPNGDGAVLQIGKVAWYAEQKFAKKDAAINLSSGWEMRLIQAEAALRSNDTATAMPLINKHRVALGLQPWTAATVADAWTMLKRERGIELWLEGRRLGDLRRWTATSTPGTLSDFEIPGSKSYLDPQRSLCFPIPDSELQTNPTLQH